MSERRWILGWAARRILSAHYRLEVRPYATKRGYDRTEVKAAAHRSLDRAFDAAWPPAAMKDEG